MVNVVYIYIIVGKAVYVGFYIYRGNVPFVYIEVIYLIHFSVHEGDWDCGHCVSCVSHLSFMMPPSF